MKAEIQIKKMYSIRARLTWQDVDNHIGDVQEDLRFLLSYDSIFTKGFPNNWDELCPSKGYFSPVTTKQAEWLAELCISVVK